MKVAVYAIAKNEEQHVARWAESCKEADYRLILDTGSTDSTIDRAYECGVEVFSASINPFVSGCLIFNFGLKCSASSSYNDNSFSKLCALKASNHA